TLRDGRSRIKIARSAPAERSRRRCSLTRSRAVAHHAPPASRPCSPRTRNETMPLRLHVGCGTVYLDGYVNLDLEVPGYSFLAGERPDLLALNRTTVDRYYKHDESQATLEKGPRHPQFCVVDRYAAIDALPFAAGSVDEIRAVQVLEHVEMK